MKYLSEHDFKQFKINSFKHLSEQRKYLGKSTSLKPHTDLDSRMNDFIENLWLMWVYWYDKFQVAPSFIWCRPFLVRDSELFKKRLNTLNSENQESIDFIYNSIVSSLVKILYNGGLDTTTTKNNFTVFSNVSKDLLDLLKLVGKNNENSSYVDTFVENIAKYKWIWKLQEYVKRFRLGYFEWVVNFHDPLIAWGNKQVWFFNLLESILDSDEELYENEIINLRQIKILWKIKDDLYALEVDLWSEGLILAKQFMKDKLLNEIWIIDRLYIYDYDDLKLYLRDTDINDFLHSGIPIFEDFEWHWWNWNPHDVPTNYLKEYWDVIKQRFSFIESELEL